MRSQESGHESASVVESHSVLSSFREPGVELDDVGPSISFRVLDQAARVLRIETGAESRESLDEIGVGSLGRDGESGSSAAVLGVDVGRSGGEKLDDCRMTFLRRLQKRGLAVAVAEVDRSPSPEQELDQHSVAAVGRSHESCGPVLRLRVASGAVRKQQPRELDVASGRGEDQSRAAEVIARRGRLRAREASDELRCPYIAPLRNGVSPWASFDFGSAPAARRSSTIVDFPRSSR
jgi:hypothetical protein